MQSNDKTKGLAIFSEEKLVKERSLKLYSYLVCRAYLRNKPNKFGDNVRIFQQKDINLSQIKRILGFEERTIKKYWEQLENSGLIKFCPHTWSEQILIDSGKIDENGNKIMKENSFIERWKERNKHKETYYEIPIKQGQQFRKIPKETLIELNEICGVNELTLKIYVALANIQEMCIWEGWEYRRFTYSDIRDILDYSLHNDIDKKIASSLNVLKAFGLIDIEKDMIINSRGVKIQCFCLNQVNFYIDYDFKDYKNENEELISIDARDQIKNKIKEDYPDVFKN